MCFFSVTLLWGSSCVITQNHRETHHYHSERCKPAHSLFQVLLMCRFMCIWIFFYSANKIPFLILGEESHFPVHSNNLALPLPGHQFTHNMVLKWPWTKGLTPNLTTITVLECFRSTGYFNYVPFELRAKVTNFVLSLWVVNIRTYGLFSAASLRLRTLKLWTTSLGNVQAFYRFKQSFLTPVTKYNFKIKANACQSK